MKGCNLEIPYLQAFVEYPIITAMFMYFMGVLGSLFSGTLINNYYYFTSFFLAIPTLLTVRELLKIAEIRKAPETKLLWYFIVTPTFIFMVLLNWYIIGVYFTMAGMRRYLEGSQVSSGLLFGLSAASNLITAVPALGLLVASRSTRDRVVLTAYALGMFAAINIPFIVANPTLWYASFNWTYNWYIENSWILLLSANIFTPLRHYVPPVIFAAFIVGIVWLRYRKNVDDPIVLAFLSMFGYVFSTYIYTPQMNLTLLPFFALLPITGYTEFLIFDAANASIIVLGLSQALLPLGIIYTNLSLFTRFSFLWWIEVIRSLWVGKFAVLNRIPSLRTIVWRREGAKAPTTVTNPVPVQGGIRMARTSAPNPQEKRQV